MEPITVMRIEIESYFHSKKCKDGVSRKPFYEITDQGTIIQYLADLEDSREEFIIEKEKMLDKGLEAPFVFSLVEAYGVGSFTYTPQVSVGANAALGAALGGTAGAVIGAATAAQANANAASYQLPVTFGTGLYYLKFNGERISNITLYPYAGGRTHYPLLCRDAHSCLSGIKYGSTTYIKLNKGKNAFSDEWVEEKFGKTRGFYGDYTLNFYSESTTGEKLANHVEFFSKVVAHYCSHRGEIGALGAYCSNKEVLDPQVFANKASSEEGVNDRNAVCQTLSLIKEYPKWCEEQQEILNNEETESKRVLDAEYSQGTDSLKKEALELSEKKKQLENDYSSLGIFQMTAKKKMKEALDACEEELKKINENLEKVESEYKKRQRQDTELYEGKRRVLLSSIRTNSPKFPSGDNRKKGRLIDGFLEACPTSISEQTEKCSCLVYLLFLLFENNRIISTKDIYHNITAAYHTVMDEDAEPIDEEQLQTWLTAFSAKRSNKALCVDETEYLNDYLWTVEA